MVTSPASFWRLEAYKTCDSERSRVVFRSEMSGRVETSFSLTGRRLDDKEVDKLRFGRERTHMSTRELQGWLIIGLLAASLMVDLLL